MAGTLVQFRLDDIVKTKATLVCESLGMDLTSYLKLSVNRLIMENGVPFSMKLDDEELKGANIGVATMILASQRAKAAGVSELTLEEINAEIAEARRV